MPNTLISVHTYAGKISGYSDKLAQKAAEKGTSSVFYSSVRHSQYQYGLSLFRPSRHVCAAAYDSRFTRGREFYFGSYKWRCR
jgi:hypothetical protein